MRRSAENIDVGTKTENIVARAADRFRRDLRHERGFVALVERPAARNQDHGLVAAHIRERARAVDAAPRCSRASWSAPTARRHPPASGGARAGCPCRTRRWRAERPLPPPPPPPPPPPLAGRRGAALGRPAARGAAADCPRPALPARCPAAGGAGSAVPPAPADASRSRECEPHSRSPMVRSANWLRFAMSRASARLPYSQPLSGRPMPVTRLQPVLHLLVRRR